MPEQRALKPQQTALKKLATRQLQAAQTTLERLHRLPAEGGDKEAAAYALDAVRNAQALVADWYGSHPNF